jgi:UDP-N-acetylglucosamine diphosphorylase / glucose-1-phosphate thymidylyltransferase / UDP-N-acetylgalactosamine diphosphorylase / glucosamine-1-phosphate N-acetyltransferase / galactosamine-1-phosphate N-acetyltransferase
MNILLDDLPFNESLYPFGTLKSMVHIRIGILSIFEKWQMIFPGKVFISSQQPGNADNSLFNKIPANIIPSAKFLKQINKEKSSIPSTDDCKILDYPWQIFEYNGWAIHEDFELITEERKSKFFSSTNQLIHPENIFIEEGAIVNHSILNATDGPIYIGKNAEILEGNLIRGPFASCEGSRVKMGSKIYGATTIGPYCLAGGEIKNSILMSYSNKAHDGYLGDSVIGSWCNLGAGTSNSNLKNTAGIVKMWSKQKNEFLRAGNKCGLVMGDYSRCAINTSFNTGTMVGVSCNIFENTFQSKYFEDFTWGNEKYIFEKAISDINNWKKLKGLSITEEEIDSLEKIYKTK